MVEEVAEFGCDVDEAADVGLRQGDRPAPAEVRRHRVLPDHGPGGLGVLDILARDREADVVADAARVRESIGVALQEAALDPLMTGRELIRLQALYRGTRPPVPLEGRTVIVVDDGIATGNSMRNALKTLRGARPEWVVVAVPVAPPEAQFRIGTTADEFACLECSPDFDLVGQCYRDFASPTDDEVRRALD